MIQGFDLMVRDRYAELLRTAERERMVRKAIRKGKKDRA